MFRAPSSALVVLAACGGAQHAATPTCPAHATIATQDDVAALATCTHLAALTIRSGATLELSPLAQLVEVAGDITVGPTLGLEELKLPALRRVGGAIKVTSNGVLRGVFLPVLERTGALTIAANAAATTVSAARLVRVDADLVVNAMGSLEIVDLTGLTTVGGELAITENPVLAMLLTPALASTRVTRIEGNRALEQGGEAGSGPPAADD